MKKIVKYCIYLSVLFISFIYLSKFLQIKRNPAFNKYWSLNSYMKPYDTDLLDIADGFYEKKKNSLDVVFFGSSYNYVNTNPNILFNEYGIVSYNFSAGSQDLITSYYYAQEMFKRQKPKLIVFEVGGSRFAEYGNNNQMHASLDQMRSGIPKLKLIYNHVTPDERIEMLFPIVTYHNRWKEIKRYDFEYLYKSKHNDMNGNYSMLDIEPFECSTELNNVIPDRIIPENTKNLIGKIYNLAKENNSKVLFIASPLASRWEDTDNYYASLSIFAKENNIDFFDFNYHYDDIGTDFSTDYHDFCHMTYWGNVKYSKYLGKIIKDMYDIPDRRGDNKYDCYNEDYKKMIESKNEFDIEYKNVFGQYPNPNEYN